MRMRIIVVLVALFGLPILARGTARAWHLHHLDGSQVEQQVADSLVSILFAPSLSVVDSVTFARERPELNDDSPVRNLGRGIYIFAVEPGTTIAGCPA